MTASIVATIPKKKMVTPNSDKRAGCAAARLRGRYKE
ncbi:hypothetical protein M7I_3610 [Glarea lozoyensis 74030]|uniref:Uncharacterized protein n=1 Tax=Glarea lozoyensis (strain ATCC 74030 / MF5533) TaxID=1104152 RepID=H0ELY5_GLAL7|nr:hypothetical protein M7I_3610 [Glarea lozoyensis 74030]